MNNSSLADPAEAFEPIVLPDYIAWTSLVLCFIILTVGTLGNLLVIIVILTSSVLRSSTNLFLLNLSVADLLVLATCTPSSLIEIVTRNDAWIMGKAMCYIAPFVELSVSHTSILTILAITVERYYAICLPLKASSVCTKSKACLTCLVIWIFAFGLTSPILAMIEYTAKPDEEPGCLTNVNTYWQKFYFIFIITVFFFIPLLILILLYIKIAHNLVPPTNTGATEDGNNGGQVVSESASVLRSRKQVVTMLATVVVFFFACMLPFKVLTLWIVTLSVDVLEVIDVETFYLLLYFCRVMFYLNSAINPILYNIMSSKFREGFRKVFHCVNWPLTPQRFRFNDGVHRRTASADSNRGRLTTSSSLRPQLSTRSQVEVRQSTSSAKLMTGSLSRQQSPKFLQPLEGPRRFADQDGEQRQQKRFRQRRYRRRHHQQRNEEEEQPFRHHHRESVDNSKNIVIIEERKILVIPTSTSSATTEESQSRSRSN